MGKLLEIERLRAVAIVMVVFHHWPFIHVYGLPFTRVSWAGVDLFFVISGFLVTNSLLRTWPDLDPKFNFIESLRTAQTAIAEFWKRRAFRVIPLVMMWMMIPLLLSKIFNASKVFGSPEDRFLEILAVTGLVYNYAHPLGLDGKFFYLWSLTVEEHFYLILPLFFVAFRTINQRILAAIACIAIVALLVRPFADSAMVQEGRNWVYLRFASHRRFDSLFAGVLIALLRDYGFGEELRKRQASIFAGVWAVVLLALIWLLPGVVPTAVSHQMGFVMLWMFSSVLVFMASLDRGTILNIPVLRRLIEYIGSRSYGIYLIHMPVVYLWQECNKRYQMHFDMWRDKTSDLFVQGFFHIVLLLILVEISYRCVEKPFIAMARRQGSSEKSTSIGY
jgi:peptidoglycan/LPS O-acetylase OafA/YrhL